MLSLSLTALAGLNAPLAAGGGIDIISTFAEGLLSFGSPCVLPLVPGYLSFISGVSVSRATGRQPAAGEIIDKPGGDLKRVLVATSVFIAGFTVVFVALYTITYFILDLLGADIKPWIQFVAGLAVIIMGLHYIGVFRLSWLNMEKRFHFNAQNRPVGLLGAFLVGAAFAAGWTPCVGPFLGAALTNAIDSSSTLSGVGLMLVYSGGLGVPFLLAGLFMNRLLAFIARIKRHFRLIEIASGVLLVMVGSLIVTNNMSQITEALGRLQR